jgi:hypothetical protein
MRRRALLGFIGTLAWSFAALAQTVNLRPGQYEMTAEITMPSGPPMPPQKQTDCITAEDLKDFSKAFQDPEFAKACQVSDYKASGSKVTFLTECKEDGVRMTGKTEMTFTADSFTGLTTTKDDAGNVITMKASGKRIGDCTK